MSPRIGSLCSGYGGLDLAVEEVFDAETVWHAETSPAASRILDARWPGAPNFGDIVFTHWGRVPPVDIITAGYPCQPFSAAGRRRGADDPRHLWPFVAAAVRRIRPRYVVLENVAGHRSLGFGRVLADLAAMRYVGSWVSLRAADVGACHGRERVFILACDSDRMARAQTGAFGGRPGTMGGPGTVERALRPDRVPAAAHAASSRRAGQHDRTSSEAARRGRQRLASGSAGDAPTPDPESLGRADGATAHHGTADREVNAPSYANLYPATDSDSDSLWLEQVSLAERDQETEPGNTVRWGKYRAAVDRHARVLGRAVPAPSQLAPKGGQQLAPRFVEWMQMLPAGWVTDVPGLTRDEQLTALGNGVIPLQAAAALRQLRANLEERAA